MASLCWLFAAPAPRITAFTLQLKNSPRDNLFSWSTPSGIVFPENSFFLCFNVSLYEILPLSLSLSLAPTFSPYVSAVIFFPSSYLFLLISNSLRNSSPLRKTQINSLCVYRQKPCYWLCCCFNLICSVTRTTAAL